MQLKIVNGSWLNKVLLLNAAEYFAAKLGGFKNKQVTIRLKLISGLKKNKKWNCRGVAFQDSALRYTIFMDRGLKARAMIKVLAHEMIHVNQWLTGKMEDVNENRYKVRWGSRFYSPNKLAYTKHPWEREAYRMEPYLYKSFTQAWSRE